MMDLTLVRCPWRLSLHAQSNGKVVFVGLDERWLLCGFTAYRVSQRGQQLVQSIQIGTGKLLLV